MAAPPPPSLPPDLNADSAATIAQLTQALLDLWLAAVQQLPCPPQAAEQSGSKPPRLTPSPAQDPAPDQIAATLGPDVLKLLHLCRLGQSPPTASIHDRPTALATASRDIPDDCLWDWLQTSGQVFCPQIYDWAKTARTVLPAYWVQILGKQGATPFGTPAFAYLWDPQLNYFTQGQWLSESRSPGAAYQQLIQKQQPPAPSPSAPSPRATHSDPPAPPLWVFSHSLASWEELFTSLGSPMPLWIAPEPTGDAAQPLEPPCPIPNFSRDSLWEQRVRLPAASGAGLIVRRIITQVYGTTEADRRRILTNATPAQVSTHQASQLIDLAQHPPTLSRLTPAPTPASPTTPSQPRTALVLTLVAHNLLHTVQALIYEATPVSPFSIAPTPIWQRALYSNRLSRLVRRYVLKKLPANSRSSTTPPPTAHFYQTLHQNWVIDAMQTLSRANRPSATVSTPAPQTLPPSAQPQVTPAADPIAPTSPPTPRSGESPAKVEASSDTNLGANSGKNSGNNLGNNLGNSSGNNLGNSSGNSSGNPPSKPLDINQSANLGTGSAPTVEPDLTPGPVNSRPIALTWQLALAQIPSAFAQKIPFPATSPNNAPPGSALPTWYRLQVDTNLHALAVIFQCIDPARYHCPGETLWPQCKLALAEGFSNAVRYAHQGYPLATPLDLEIRVTDRGLELRLWDYGTPFAIWDTLGRRGLALWQGNRAWMGWGWRLERLINPLRHHITQLCPPSLKQWLGGLLPLAVGGRGLPLMQEIADYLDYLPLENGRNCLVLIKYFPNPDD